MHFVKHVLGKLWPTNLGPISVHGYFLWNILLLLTQVLFPTSDCFFACFFANFPRLFTHVFMGAVQCCMEPSGKRTKLHRSKCSDVHAVQLVSDAEVFKKCQFLNSESGAVHAINSMLVKASCTKGTLKVEGYLYTSYISVAHRRQKRVKLL